jgi:hypothetical protein
MLYVQINKNTLQYLKVSFILYVTISILCWDTYIQNNISIRFHYEHTSPCKCLYDSLMLHFTEKCKTTSWFLWYLSHLTSLCLWSLKYISLLFSFKFFEVQKSHIHLSLLKLFRRVYPMPHVIFCNILQCGLSTLSVAHDYAFNSYTVTHSLSMRNPLCQGIMTSTKWPETFKNPVLGRHGGWFSVGCSSCCGKWTSAYYLNISGNRLAPHNTHKYSLNCFLPFLPSSHPVW